MFVASTINRYTLCACDLTLALDVDSASTQALDVASEDAVDEQRTAS
jgi:hypothetical protein